MQERKIKDYFVIMLKGLAMGAADVVPGVSGGTIAFISGIYEELLTSISSVSFKSLKILKSEGVKSFWKAINGNFLISLVVGIGISILSLVKLISWLLDTKPILVWSFFFGLVLASILYIGKQIVQWKFLTFFLLVLSAFIAYWITTLEPLVSAETSPIYLFFAGALAICAMILPGISGAFILVLLGAYKSVLEAVDNKDIKLIAIIGAGAIVGLLTFSRILKWLFAHYKNMTLAILTGFVLGSLNKIWPWKETLTWRMNSHGLQVPVNEQSVSPFTFEGDPQLLYAIILAIIGFFSILFLEKMAVKNE
ncbi:MAG: putative membrane protein [Urechidicola sp.]|jgi:putative membrane protein